MGKYSSIKKACKINDIIFNELVRDFKFKTEQEIYLYILKRFRQLKVKPAFPPIVANNHARIHPKPRKNRLERGFLILDFGCKVNGYCSDMTRTIFLGKSSAAEKRLYDLVLRCQEKSVALVKPGISYKQLDADTRADLGRYKKYFVHSLGHGVGKRIHMKPRISKKSEEYAMLGDCITIEPGIYIKKKSGRIGIRIEDTLYIRAPNGSLMNFRQPPVEVLTRARKDLVCVKI